MKYTRKLLPDEVALFSDSLRIVFQRFRDANKEIYLVGAGVRKILAGEKPVDCDLTTNAKPEETLTIMRDFKPFYENEFGMVGVPMEGETFEITTYRSESGYTDHRRPDEVIWGDSLEEDVIRRDFTMNAVVIGPSLAKATEGKGDFELIDLVGGLKDFEDGVVRTVGEADQRFKEDALRMMRAIRFASTLGFRIDQAALTGITKNSPLLASISRERVRDELMKTLAGKFPADAVRLLISTGLMSYIIPELLEAKDVAQNGHHVLDVLEHSIGALEGCASGNPLVRLATLIHDIGKPKTKRFRCRRCKKMIKRSVTEGETIVCDQCGQEQPTRETITFYGHEVVGSRMAEKIADNLRLSAKDKKKLVTLVRWHMFSYQPTMTDAAIRRFIRNVGKENVNDMILLRIGDRKGGGSKTTSWRLMELQKRIGEQLFEPMEINDMVVNGKDVMETLKIDPGPAVGKILKALFEEVLEDTSKNSKEYLEKRVRELALED